MVMEVKVSIRRRNQDYSGEPLALSLGQAAKAAGMSRQTLAKHLGEIAHRRTGRRVLITRLALERWLEGHDAQEAA